MTKRKQNSAKNNPFLKLDKRQQTFIKMDYEGNHSNKEIAHNPKVNIKRIATISNWRASKWYKPAHDAYVSSLINHKYKDKALSTLYDLLDAKSEMVRLQAATSILKLAGMFSDNSTPELDKAKTRKANAEADIAETQAKAIKDSESGNHETIIVDNVGEPINDNNDNQKD